jgi:hypothetical protein
METGGAIPEPRGRFTVNQAAVTQSEDQDSVKVGPPPRVETRG